MNNIANTMLQTFIPSKVAWVGVELEYIFLLGWTKFNAYMHMYYQ